MPSKGTQRTEKKKKIRENRAKVDRNQEKWKIFSEPSSSRILDGKDITPGACGLSLNLPYCDPAKKNMAMKARGFSPL